MAVSSGPQGVRVRGQEKWTPPPQPLLSALDRMLNLSLLSVLSMKLRDKEETQKHLNILKERFLHSCGALPVPPGKKNKLVSWKHQEETQKTEEGKKKLSTLEENQRMVVSSLEELEVTKERLDEENRITRSRVEEEEEEAHQVLLQRDQAVLHLPPLPSRSHTDHQTLQERLMEAIPDVGGAMKALRNLPELRPVSSYIELANQHTQLRVTTATTTNTQHT
ncbi:centromere protein Q [Engraulis encrasicolus]|uniref:centromere protein Q n=1 Tax=Engraulis encrasicolus TaxID=184585 RepID=UPI002FD233FB